MLSVAGRPRPVRSALRGGDGTSPLCPWQPPGGGGAGSGGTESSLGAPHTRQTRPGCGAPPVREAPAAGASQAP